MIKFLKKVYRFLFYNFPLFFHRIKNNNKDFVIISRDCIGGFIYNQYKIRFYSPTINLFLSMNDFNLLCNNLVKYLNGFFIKGECGDYPVGFLHSEDNNLPAIKVHFIHYETYEEAINRWTIRKERSLKKLNNVYVVNNCTRDSDIDEINQSIIQDFNSIPYKKVIFTRSKTGFENEYLVKPIDKYYDSFILEKHRFTWKRVFNDFDFNKFFRRNK